MILDANISTEAKMIYLQQRDAMDRQHDAMDRQRDAMDRQRDAMDRQRDTMHQKEKELWIERNRSLRLQLMTANENLLRIRGNLNLRGLIEEYENQPLFRQTRRSLKIKNKSDPSRQQIWNEILSSDDPTEVRFIDLQKCLEGIGELATGARVICDIYNQISRSIHKADFMVEKLVLQTSSLYGNQVQRLVCFKIVKLLFYFICIFN